MRIWTLLLPAFALCGCVNAQDHARDVEAGQQGDRLTAGVVQREVRQGMPASEVAATLGSPNIVTRNPDGTQTWVYDRIATDTVYSSSQGGISSLLLGGGISNGTLLGGLGGSSYGRSAGAVSRSQRTLTVVIRFDERDTVRTFTYHQSSF
jgi:outer membrane protein assembly factor BamE (lipoprotein component of BamABCDE complex)